MVGVAVGIDEIECLDGVGDDDGEVVAGSSSDVEAVFSRE